MKKPLNELQVKSQKLKGKGQKWVGIFAFCLLTVDFCFSGDLGTLSGFVKFPGETPPRNMFANASDADCPRGIPQTHLLVKQETRGLKNAVIVLDREDRRVMPTLLQNQLSTVGCQLLPRIQWVLLGSSLALINKDGAHHHLRGLQRNSTVFEADLSPQTLSVRRPLVTPGLTKINCDNHLWERAWIYVSPHGSVAISDAEGKFSIKNIPVGRYHVRAWHEGWEDHGHTPDDRTEFVAMQDERDVKIRDQEVASVIFDTLKVASAPGSIN